MLKYIFLMFFLSCAGVGNNDLPLEEGHQNAAADETRSDNLENESDSVSDLEDSSSESKTPETSQESVTNDEFENIIDGQEATVDDVGDTETGVSDGKEPIESDVNEQELPPIESNGNALPPIEPNGDIPEGTASFAACCYHWQSVSDSSSVDTMDASFCETYCEENSDDPSFPYCNEYASSDFEDEEFSSFCTEFIEDTPKGQPPMLL